MDLYAQNILDRYKNPINKDENIDIKTSHSEANRSCGDAINIKVEIKDDKLIDYSFSGNGCAISMASADMIFDLTKDMLIDDILGLKKESIYEMLGIEISVRRSKCALLSLLSLQNAILEYQGKENRNWNYYA